MGILESPGLWKNLGIYIVPLSVRNVRAEYGHCLKSTEFYIRGIERDIYDNPAIRFLPTYGTLVPYSDYILTLSTMIFYRRTIWRNSCESSRAYYRSFISMTVCYLIFSEE